MGLDFIYEGNILATGIATAYLIALLYLLTQTKKYYTRSMKDTFD